MVSAFTVGGLGPKILNLHTLNLQALNLLDPTFSEVLGFIAWRFGVCDIIIITPQHLQ